MTAALAPVCPLGWRCEACGAEGERPAAGGGERLAVVEVATAAGLVCVTLCASCTVGVRSSGLPITVETAGRLAAQHLAHLGAGERGCDACRVMGPLLTGPGTSGRTWRCGCGATWSGRAAAAPAAGGSP